MSAWLNQALTALHVTYQASRYRKLGNMAQDNSSPPAYSSETLPKSAPEIKSDSHQSQSHAPIDQTVYQSGVPPYRASHAFVNNTEELAALDEFAESKQYISGGSQGTLAFGGYRGGGLNFTRFAGDEGNEEVIRERQEAVDTMKRAKAEKKMMKDGTKEGRRQSVGERLMKVLGGNGERKENDEVVH